MNAWVEPEGAPDTASQSTSSSVSAMKPAVSTNVASVIQRCRRMMTSKPRIPAPTTSTAVTTNPRTLTPLPLPQPSSSNTVAVPSEASETSTVSQPTSSTQDRNVGSALPVTPNAARLSTIVGAEPRLPASATTPQSANDSTMPMTAAAVACQKATPNPTMNEP